MIDRAVSAHIGTGGARVAGARMEGKTRYIFPVIITAIIVFIVSAVVTFINIGFRTDFVPRWLNAFITGWPVAAVVAFIAIPYARRLAIGIARLLGDEA